jgi:ribosomal protein S18 acetylase RimI-like enzyme
MDIPKLVLRRATLHDVDFLAATDLRVDIEDEPDGRTPTYIQGWGEDERLTHKARIESFVTSPDQTAWIYKNTAEATPLPVAMILALFRDRRKETRTEANDFLFRFIDENMLPPDRRFCEVFQLWVHPAYRRRGLGTALKQQVECEARQRGIGMLYTHTRESNPHVVALNRKLGYAEIRRGPMWDDVIRVSMIKYLSTDSTVSDVGC